MPVNFAETKVILPYFHHMGQNITKLFCIPFSGGNAYSYLEFNKFLPAHVELVNLELPGRGKRVAEKLLTSIESMTEDLYQQIESRIDGQYAIFGHSLGALLGLTLSRFIGMKQLNLPSVLFVSGLTAPSLIQPSEKYNLPENQFIGMLREMEGIPEELLNNESFLQYFLPVIKSDFKAFAHYQYEPATIPLNIPLVVLLGTNENINDQDAACWQLETGRPVTICRFEGGHFYIFKETNKVCQLIAENCASRF